MTQQIPSLNFLTKQNVLRKMVKLGKNSADKVKAWINFVGDTERQTRIVFPMYPPYYNPPENP